jgi:thiamine-phosphate pyrophosphorylase
MIADRCRLYLITPETFDLQTFPDLLARALDASDVAAVQLRLKDADDDVWKRTVDALRGVVQSRRVPVLLNDRADIVVATGSDGVHVGQQDREGSAAPCGPRPRARRDVQVLP